ncbi:hypothetical protein B0I37DRAFT_188184 [Chaetomium sp. MPI-CAGE-AT-0009]|nr:hypothetical protein B0I37DRAFT_188184 [Chaetomium sp. MPI-CAGE-AT-0009]
MPHNNVQFPSLQVVKWPTEPRQETHPISRFAIQMEEARSQPEPNRNRRPPNCLALTMRKARKSVCHHERRTPAEIQPGAQAGIVWNSTKLHTRFQIMVRMTVPRPGFHKALAPQTHMNTLDSSPSRPPGPLQTTNTFRPTDQPPPAKRQKTQPDTRRRGPGEEITDIEQDASWSDPRGSQTSFAHSVSPGIQEYQVVEESAKGTGRSNRRSRQPQTNYPPLMTGRVGRGGMSRPTENIDDNFDVLAPAPKPTPRQQRTARLISTRPNAITSDPADACILGQSTRPGQSPRSKKRPGHETADDQDELARGTSSRGSPPASTGQPIEGSPKNKSPSLSQRGDIKSTKWAGNRGDYATTGVSVAGAVCQPNFEFVANNSHGSCFLRPTDGPALRVFTDQTRPAEPYHWLKITGKANTLVHHPDSNLIKLSQSMDQASVPIGGLMLIKLSSNAEASWVVEWVRKHLTVHVVRAKEGAKLVQSYEKLHHEVAHSSSQASGRRLSDDTPARLPQATKGSPRENAAQIESVPASSRTPIRHQMQVSAQQTEAPLPQSGTVVEHVSTSARSLRTRQITQPGQTLEPPRVSAVRRWSDEHREWARDWNKPLILRRTTVDKEDIPRLDEGQCLNDNLIGYGLRYLFDVFKGRTADLHERVYLHNSFFYEKLKAGRGAINYDGVKNWTAKVDLLSYDYIIVPVNEHYHWWVAIICNPGKLDPASRRVSDDTRGLGHAIDRKVDGAASDVEMTDVTEKRPVQASTDKLEIVKSDLVVLVSDDKNVSIDLTSTSRPKQTKKPKPGARTYSPDDPRIITLDSLGSNHPLAIAHLKKYLFAEFEHKRNTVITEHPGALGMRAVNIPEQDNLCDCGVYLLGYIQEFVKDPDQFVRTLLQKESPDWKFNPSDLRNLWRETIFSERRQHLKPQLASKGKLEGSAAASTPKSSVEPSSHPSRDNTREVTNASNGKLGTETGFSEHITPTSASGSPMNVDTTQVNDASTEPARCAPQPTKESEQPQTSGMACAPSPQPPVPQRDGLDESAVPIPTVEGDPVLPTVEAPDAEELPSPPSQSRDGPRFLSALPSTPPRAPAEDKKPIVEVELVSFHSSHAPKSATKQGRSVPSSPAGARRRRAAKARPQHTSSHFVVDGGPVVERAEVVRSSDPIDLTDD